MAPSVFRISFLGLCTYKETEEQMIKQRLYRCDTCHMTGKLSTGDKYCICEICINNCHAGHDTTFIDQLNFHGFCDCGDEGSRGIRSCKMLKGTVPSKLYTENIFRYGLGMILGNTFVILVSRY